MTPAAALAELEAIALDGAQSPGTLEHIQECVRILRPLTRDEDAR